MSSVKTITPDHSANEQQWFAKIGDQYEQHRNKMEKVLTKKVGVTKTVNVSGFDVPLVDEKATESLRKRMVKEAEVGSLLKRKLVGAGIKPIAILPEDIFGKIIAKVNFFTFYRMQPDGRVYGNGKKYQESNVGESTALTVAQIVELIASVGLAIMFFRNGSVLGWFFAVHLAIAVICVGATENDTLTGGWFVEKVLFPLAFPIVAIAFFSEARYKLKHAKYLLWPKKNDIDDVADDLFKLHLPEPPDSVKSILAKCHQNKIATFLTIAPNAFEVILDEKTKRQLVSKYDPVIAVREKGMVAILAQFGDFPEEKEVVEYIAQHFDATRKDLIPIQQN